MLKGHGSLQRYQLLFLTGRLFVAPSASGQLLKLLRLQSQPLSSFIFIKTITVSFFFLHTYRIFFFRSVHGRLCSQGSSICISSLFLIEQQEETRRNATCQKLSSKVDFCVCVHGCADLWGSYVTVISDKKKKKDSLLSYKNCKLNCTFATQWNAHTCTNYSYFSHRVCMWSML